MRKVIGLALAAILLCGSEALSQTSMSFSISQTSLSANAGGAGTIGTAFTAPPGSDAALVTWTTSYSAPPASVTMLLQASLDNSTWFTLDSSTAVGGELRNIATSARFFRCNISAVSGAVNKTCSFVLKRSNAATSSSGTTFAGDVTSGGEFYASNGTSGAPSYSFTSEPTLGFWRSAAGAVTLQGGLATTASLQLTGATTNGEVRMSGNTILQAPAGGTLALLNFSRTIGSTFKVDALPTIASGFGTSPAVTAGSTPFAGSVDVGTGGVAASGVITFGGTAFPSAPFCVIGSSTGTYQLRSVTTTTTIQLIANVAFTASDKISWICVSAK